MVIDSHVSLLCRWLFANSVKLCWNITEPVGPLGSTNRNWWGAKLLAMSVLISSVDYVHLCHPLRTQHHCLPVRMVTS